MDAESKYAMGVQPLDGLLTELALTNHDLVRASTAHLTHKMVQKGRSGRQLTRNAQGKIVDALNVLSPEKKYTPSEVFNYKGR